ncbi:UDP-galactose/UDP-glucose transporter 5-like [Typha angustifolia]|uniref:UDP-galactose/UDP-glucose transporter 5-like n=1 Tax=Typha angustifolia TaxID=59011 RepID=UPI003C2BDA3C
MAEPPVLPLKERKLLRLAFAVVGIMSTLVIYGVLQEKIMRIPYGKKKEYFKYSLFLVFCNRLATSVVSGGVLLASKRSLDPVAPIYKYCAISISNILTTTCQYEALKYVSFPVQTLAKCAKMIPVMVWGTLIMQKRYHGKDYLFAVLVTVGCSLFILYPASADISPYNAGRESTILGVLLMLGYLGFDGFTSTFQDKLFKGYDMEIHNQIFYTTICSCLLSLSGLVVQGHLLSAVDFMFRQQDCFYDVIILSTVATTSQFFISYTIRTFGALTFATIMTTRQLVSILLSCVWFAHPLSWKQWIGAAVVFGALYAKTFLRSKPQKPVPGSLLDGSDEHTANNR